MLSKFRWPAAASPTSPSLSAEFEISVISDAYVNVGSSSEYGRIASPLPSTSSLDVDDAGTLLTLMATVQHYAWAGGHVVHLLCAAKYLLAWLTLRSSGQLYYYKAAYVGAILSYAIVCYKSLFQGTQPAGDLSRRAMTDENVHYLFLAVFWWISKPVPVTLIPFATFSLFHVLTFLRSNVLMHFFPPTPPATAGQPAVQHPFLKKIQSWIKANYDPAMHVVAYTEVLIFLRVVLGAILFQNSLLAPIIYAHFLRLRYYQSPKFTQKAVHHITSLIDGYARKPGNPPIVVTVWDKIQFFVKRWGGSVLAPQQPTEANARR